MNQQNAALSARQQAMGPIAALAATGDIKRLGPALEQGLDAGLTVNEAKEILVQVYAYAGFPRSLNALGELMKVVEARRARGVADPEGRAPSHPAPTGDALLTAGTANQTKLSGAPVKGPLFEFAPSIDAYLKTHLFGDIFERDNLDWQSREIATVSMLAALEGVESQLKSHVKIALNTGLSRGQLEQLADVLAQRVGADAGRRAQAAVAEGTGAK
nr:carboxymuconolactone decarboxylase family protein [Massilia sp.]